MLEKKDSNSYLINNIPHLTIGTNKKKYLENVLNKISEKEKSKTLRTHHSPK